MKYQIIQNNYRLLESQIDQLNPKHKQFEGKINIELDKSGIVNVKGVELIETF